MWRCLPALLCIWFLVYYDATRTLSRPWRLALFTFCLLLVLLCFRALVRFR